ncbi:MAG: hypothetical protein N2318_01255 [Meiothermus sp.]|nr:hypothetical protein [Meiothermus sp.]
MSLPIRRVTFYKHGLGFFERQGPFEGDELRLEFPRAAMDDILKSLVVISQDGQILGLEFETPADRNPKVSRKPLALSPEHSLTDLLQAFRGRWVRVRAGSETLEGQLLGAELEDEEHLKRGRLSLYLPGERVVRVLELPQVERLDLLDEAASRDLEFFLRTIAADEERSSALLRLSQGSHELQVSYIGPAPAWRVSYRLLANSAENHPDPQSREILLQGWGLFDNTLDEDLEKVQLSLVAGMPVSFRYALHQPHTPERPLIEDEERTVAGPIEYAAINQSKELPHAEHGLAAEIAPAMAMRASFERMVEKSTQPVASGAERGALFAYRIEHPVSVRRGQSAMVPILSARLSGRRELLFNERKQAKNPVASLRFKNTSGLSLERGPVTVLEQAEYAGEAVLDFSPGGAEIIVAYAVELGVQVRTQERSATRLAKLSLKSGYLLIEKFNIQYTHYEIQNNTSKPLEVVVEHNRQAGYALFDTPEPDESTSEVARWSVFCQAQNQSRFVVAERQLQARREEVRGLKMQTLESYFKRQYLDAAGYTKLKALLALYQQLDDLEAEQNHMNQERQKIYSRQTQIQGNLAPLAGAGEEGRLRSRLVAELGRLEDALQTLEAQETGLIDQKQTLQQQIEQALEQLG